MSSHTSGTRTRTILFTDIENSTGLTEQQPELMRAAISAHDTVARKVVDAHEGTLVQLTGDGIYAIFDSAVNAVRAAIELQQAVPTATRGTGLELSMRCGLHLGAIESRENELFFGTAINRTARIMSAAHGGQILVSEAVALASRDDRSAAFGLRGVGTVRLRGLDKPERVFQVLHTGLCDAFPALRAQESTPNNLPHQATSLIGREQDLESLQRLLAETRLLTLTGVGGIGKTRLALQLVNDALAAYPDGAWVVDLSALSDADLVVEQTASALSIREQSGRALIDAVVDFVRDRRLVLVLDNCEHVLRPSASLASTLLRAAAHVQVVATSREPLRIEGETVFEVSPLGLPSAKTPPSAAAVSVYQAIRLFTARGRQANPAFDLTDSTATYVVEICRRLDGIPLALELAAARLRAMPVQALARALTDRFRVLTSGDRTKLPRQQTLRALIDWSHDLLDMPERTLLRRLSVFSGSAALESVQSICMVDGLEASDALDVLSRLVEKSMVIVDADCWRYRLMETVRQYAMERLDESGEAAAIRARHASAFVAFGERARPGIIGAEQAVWLERMDAERENLLGAHAWYGESMSDEDGGFALAHCMKQYWLNRGLPGMGYQMTVDALSRGSDPTLLRSRALFDAGQLAYFMGSYGQARKHLDESVAVANTVGSRSRVAAALQPLGMACLADGDVEAARRYLEQAVELAHEFPDKRDLAAAMNALAQFHRSQGGLGVAHDLYVLVVAIMRSLGDRESVALSLLNLAMVFISRGTPDAAPEPLAEALDIARDIGSRPVGQSVLDVAAGLASARGDAARCARLYGAAEAQVSETGLQRDPADQAFLMPLIDAARTSMGRPGFSQTESVGKALAYDEVMGEVHNWLSMQLARP